MTIAEKWALIEAEDLAPAERKVFDQIVANGNSPQFALACICRSIAKMSHSDRAFGENARRRMNDMRQEDRDKIVAIARRAGIDTEGKYYCGRLGKYSDPGAWCSTDSDVLDTCRKRNYGCEGAVKNKMVDLPLPDAPLLAPDIVNREVWKLLQKDPKLREKVKKGKVKKEALKERVIAKHGKKRLKFGS